MSDELFNGWTECKRDIYHRLTIADRTIEELRIKQDLIATKMITLETRSGLIGLIAGCIPALFVVILYLIFKG